MRWVQDAIHRVNASLKAILGLKREGSALPVVMRKMECVISIIQLGSTKAQLRCHFVALAAALLLSKGAYPTLLQWRNHLLPARVESFFEPTKGSITLEMVVNALFDCSVTVHEVNSWDDFVFQYSVDYLAMSDTSADDDICLAMQEREHEGSPSDFVILQCLPPLRWVPHLQITGSVVTDTLPLVPEGYDPEEGEFIDSETLKITLRCPSLVQYHLSRSERVFLTWGIPFHFSW